MDKVNVAARLEEIAMEIEKNRTFCEKIKEMVEMVEFEIQDLEQERRFLMEAFLYKTIVH